MFPVPGRLRTPQVLFSYYYVSSPGGAGWREKAENLKRRCPRTGLQDTDFQHPCFMRSHAGEWVRGAPSTLVTLNVEPLSASCRNVNPFAPSLVLLGSCRCWAGPLSSTCIPVSLGEGRCWSCADRVGVADDASLEWDKMSVANSCNLTAVLKILGVLQPRFL